MKKKCLLMILIVILFCQKTQIGKAKHTFFRMDTVVEVTLVLKGKGNSEKNVEETWKKIDSLLADFEIRFSQTHQESEVLKINRDRDTSHILSEILTEMLSIGLGYGDTLQGMFDLTILPIKELWGFGESERRKVIPSAESISELLPYVDYKKVTVNDEARTIDFDNDTILVDVGGIAKGFSLREVARILDTLGYADYLIVAGGDIIGKGRRPDGKMWKLGVKHPRRDDGLLGAFRLDTGSVVTSGDYERFWIKNGKRYHHIFNPKTGYPSTKNQSLTVWCLDPVIADVLSTGLFGRSGDSILAFIEKRLFTECVVVDSEGEVLISSGWEDKVQIFE